MKLKEEPIDYRDGDAELSGLLIWDSNELAHPVVVVVHGGAGLDDHATIGYVAYHAVSDQRSFLAVKAFLAEVFGMELMTARARELNV